MVHSWDTSDWEWTILFFCLIFQRKKKIKQSVSLYQFSNWKWCRDWVVNSHKLAGMLSVSELHYKVQRHVCFLNIIFLYFTLHFSQIGLISSKSCLLRCSFDIIVQRLVLGFFFFLFCFVLNFSVFGKVIDGIFESIKAFIISTAVWLHCAFAQPLFDVNEEGFFFPFFWLFNFIWLIICSFVLLRKL